MVGFTVLIPAFVVGVVVWGVLGVFRQRGQEPFTLATAAALYSRAMALAGLWLLLVGAALLVKMGLSLVDVAYAYPAFQVPAGVAPPFGPPSPEQRRLEDLLMALVMLSAGALVGGSHAVMARFTRGLRGGAPPWVTLGTLVMLVALTGLVALVGAVLASYQTLQYFVLGPGTGRSFADAAGTAVVFVPAWALAIALLLRRLRRSEEDRL